VAEEQGVWRFPAQVLEYGDLVEFPCTVTVRAPGLAATWAAEWHGRLTAVVIQTQCLAGEAQPIAVVRMDCPDGSGRIVGVRQSDCTVIRTVTQTPAAAPASEDGGDRPGANQQVKRQGP